MIEMKTEEFDFDLPEELIAQHPIEKRDDAKMMLLNRNTGEVKHQKFHDIIKYLHKGDILVLNDTKVLPARLFGVKEKTQAKIELLLLKSTDKDTWECLVKPAKRVKVGTVVSFGDEKLKLLQAECIEEKDEGIRTFKFIYEGVFYEILDKLGTMPLPPYIKEQLKDKERYQTVYAKTPGSAAAPTAGLHFTKELLKEIENMGVEICYITLHVGLGTFRPVNVDDITNHTMHSEYYMMTKNVAEKLNKAKKEGRRIIAVGTTTTRTLETIMKKYETFTECSGWTNIFIYPGYKFKAIDGLITNFHLPKSTLIMLVSAFSSKEYILNAYKQAIENKYRFFSFGDCMFIY